MTKLKFFKCQHCGNVIVKLIDSGISVVCCGEKMTEIKANSVEASFEKHIPVVIQKDMRTEIVVGSVLHPMLLEHFIEFIVVETETGYVYKQLKYTDKPSCIFDIHTNDITAVYAYCNLHGLWTFNK